MADDGPDQPRLVRGVRSAVRNDASAFSYSILITATFAAVQMEVGSLTANRLFLFVLGATGAFVVLEAGTSRMFQERMRQEPSDVVVLGTALAPLSVAAALGTGMIVLQAADGWLAWLLTPAVVTASYVVFAGLQLAIARRYEEDHPPEN